MAIELKPCPFCGDNQQLNYVELSNGLHYIECERCGAAPHRLGAWNRETAVKYWNSVNRWIPCSERLPEENEYVLAFVKRKHSISRAILSVLIEGEWKIGVNDCSGGFNVVGVITHWMPLPEPPKEGASDD